ncbi:MAG: hypothetical protein ACPLRN_00575 [Microgenomates group bacterium]
MFVYALDIEKQFAPAQKIKSIADLVNLGLSLAGTGAALIFLIMALRGGYMYIVGGDDPKALEKARATMIFAAIGLVVVVVSFVAVRLIGKILGIENFI